MIIVICHKFHVKLFCDARIFLSFLLCTNFKKKLIFHTFITVIFKKKTFKNFYFDDTYNLL